MKGNQVAVVKVSNQYKMFIVLILCLVTLVGCTNQEITKKLEENETEQTKELSVEDQKRQEKAQNLEKNIIKYMDEKKYEETISYFNEMFIRGVDRKLRPTEKTIELYNFAVQSYFEKQDMFYSDDYKMLSLDKEYLNEDVKSFIYQKFSVDIAEIEASIEKEKAEILERAEISKAEREAREEAQRIEEAKHRVYIGMTKEQVLATDWGEPDDINRTITSNGTSEQWVYSDYGKYLYFDDGILTTIQD